MDMTEERCNEVITLVIVTVANLLEYLEPNFEKKATTFNYSMSSKNIVVQRLMNSITEKKENCSDLLDMYELIDKNLKAVMFYCCAVVLDLEEQNIDTRTNLDIVETTKAAVRKFMDLTETTAEDLIQHGCPENLA